MQLLTAEVLRDSTTRDVIACIPSVALLGMRDPKKTSHTASQPKAKRQVQFPGGQRGFLKSLPLRAPLEVLEGSPRRAQTCRKPR